METKNYDIKMSSSILWRCVGISESKLQNKDLEQLISEGFEVKYFGQATVVDVSIEHIDHSKETVKHGEVYMDHVFIDYEVTLRASQEQAYYIEALEKAYNSYPGEHSVKDETGIDYAKRVILGNEGCGLHESCSAFDTYYIFSEDDDTAFVSEDDDTAFE